MKKIMLIGVFLLFSSTVFAAKGDEIIGEAIPPHVIGDVISIPVTCYDEKLIVTVIENIRLVAWWVGRPPDAPSYTKVDGYVQRNNTIDFLHEILTECVFFNVRFNTVLVRYVSGPHRISVTIFVHVWELGGPR